MGKGKKPPVRQQEALAAAEQRSARQIEAATEREEAANAIPIGEIAKKLRRPLGRLALEAEFGKRRLNKWMKAIAACEHADVDWGPVEVEYDIDNNHVHQEGTCNDCARLVQREFVANAAHTVIDDAPEGVHE
jgi:hypothetical protein